MIQDVPSEKRAQRVNERVLREIRACNATLKARHGNNPHSSMVINAKAVIRYSYEVGLPLGEARLAFAKLPCVERSKRYQRETSIAYCNNK